MIEFSEKLEAEVRKILEDAVGVGTDSTDYVKLFDDHLHDVELSSLPYVVVTVRSDEKEGEAEVGSKWNLHLWTVHVYYLDTTATYTQGKVRRSKILSKINRALEQNKRINNLEVTDENGNMEYVWDSEVTNVIFDSSGQDEYYSFVDELYLSVHTAKT